MLETYSVFRLLYNAFYLERLSEQKLLPVGIRCWNYNISTCWNSKVAELVIIFLKTMMCVKIKVLPPYLLKVAKSFLIVEITELSETIAYRFWTHFTKY